MICGALADDLSALTLALDRPGVDLLAMLDELAVGVRRAVRSYVGVTMTLVVDEDPLTFTVIDDGPGDIAASIEVPLSALCPADPGSALVYYAAAPGAFDAFAIDLSRRRGVGVPAVDQHLVAPEAGSGLSGLADLSQLNQAIGILMAHGHTGEWARAELRRTIRLSGPPATH